MNQIHTTDPQDEMFDVVDENDEIISEATRAQVHHDNRLIHRVVHIWILNDRDEILLQQRSLSKDKAPGLWDMSCGGHVKKGDSAELTAERELDEELSIHSECICITKFVESQDSQSEMLNLFYTRHNGPFDFPKEEVEQVRFFSREEAFQFIQNDPKASYFSKKEIPMIFNFLDNESQR